jgi:hypothetical protein
LNRSLGQIIGPDCLQGEFRCPEAYYLERGRYVTSEPSRFARPIVVRLAQ